VNSNPAKSKYWCVESLSALDHLVVGKICRMANDGFIQEKNIASRQW